MVTLPPVLAQTLELVLPVLTATSAHWQCSPVDDAGPWTLRAEGQRVDVARSGDDVRLTVPVGDHLVIVARGTPSTLCELGPWMRGALRAQRSGSGRWQWERSKRTGPWVLDRDVVRARLARGDRLGTGIRGRCFTEHFLVDGALTRFCFDEGFAETLPGDEQALAQELADDPRDVVGEPGPP
jgi:hypothetical protein